MEFNVVPHSYTQICTVHIASLAHESLHANCFVFLKLVFSVECFLTIFTFVRGAKMSIILVFRVENYLTIFTCDSLHTACTCGFFSTLVSRGERTLAVFLPAVEGERRATQTL